MRRFLIVSVVVLAGVFLATTVISQTTTEKATKAATDAVEKAKASGVTTQDKSTTPAKTEKSAAKDVTGACKEIKQICDSAGFDQNEAKKGIGLWRHCINPIMQGKTKVPGAKKPLPTVDPKLVAACKAKNPEFGSGPAGSN
jgi:hypothetical protein